MSTQSETPQNGFAFQRPKFLTNLTLLLIGVLSIAGTILVLNNRQILPLPAAYLLPARLIVVCVLSLLLVRLVLKYTEGRFFNFLAEDLQVEQRIFISKLYRFSLYFAAVLFILNQLGVSLASISISMGLLATGFALAIREAIISYIAWFIILIKKPFRIGDTISFEEQMGEVTRVGTFYSTLNCFESDEQFVKIPNKMFLGSAIKNYGNAMPIPERIALPLASTPLEPAALLSAAGRLLESLPESKPPMAANFEAHGDGMALVLDYTADFKERSALRSRLLPGLLMLREQHLPKATPPATGPTEPATGPEVAPPSG